MSFALDLHVHDALPVSAIEPSAAAALVGNAVARDVPSPVFCLSSDRLELDRFLRLDLIPALVSPAPETRGRAVFVAFRPGEAPADTLLGGLAGLFPEAASSILETVQWTPVEVAVALLPEDSGPRREARTLVVSGLEVLGERRERERRSLFRVIGMLAKRRGVVVVLAGTASDLAGLEQVPGMGWMDSRLPRPQNGLVPEKSMTESGEDGAAFRGVARRGHCFRGGHRLATAAVSVTMPVVLVVALVWFFGPREERPVGLGGERVAAIKAAGIGGRR